jgi:hypothetical protein
MERDGPTERRPRLVASSQPSRPRHLEVRVGLLQDGLDRVPDGTRTPVRGENDVDTLHAASLPPAAQTPQDQNCMVAFIVRLRPR